MSSTRYHPPVRSPGGSGDETTGMAADSPTLPAPARRGATLVPEAVVARIAARAAREALSGRAAMPPVGPRLGSPRSTAVVHKGSARISVSVDLPYPTDIGQTCGEIRRYLAERVPHLTGLRIDHITVSVHRLVPSRSLGQGRVQ